MKMQSIEEWRNSIGLDQYGQKFIKNHLDFDLLGVKATGEVMGAARSEEAHV